MAAESATRPKPVYITIENLLEVLAHLKQHGIPPSIDATAMPSKFNNGTSAQVLSALRYLRLIDKDSEATTELRELVDAYQTDRWAHVLAPIIEAAYGDVIDKLDLTTATVGNLSERFSKVAHGQVLAKAMRFYQNALREAKVPVSSYLDTKGAAGVALGGQRKARSPRKPKPQGRQIVEEAVYGPKSRAAPDGWTEHEYALRPPEKVRLLLPNDLEQDEAAVLHQWIDLLTFRVNKKGG